MADRHDLCDIVSARDLRAGYTLSEYNRATMTASDTKRRAMKQTTILVVDDHSSVRTLVTDYLSEQGYRVLTASDGNEGLLVARRTRPDLILLDVMMPGLDGLGFLRAYRRDNVGPVILLTARVEETDKVVGLELGADDYVTKPFGMKELVARIRALLRRASVAQQPAAVEQFQVGDLLLDRTTREVSVAGQPVSLTPSEFTLLSLLMASPAGSLPANSCWSISRATPTRASSARLTYIFGTFAKSWSQIPLTPRYIETVFGAGYRCRVQPER